MKKILRKKNILIILSITSILILWSYLSINYYINLNIPPSKVECIDLNEKDIIVLNDFFKNTKYNWNYEYWCNLDRLKVFYNKGSKVDINNPYVEWNIPKELWKLINLNILTFWNQKLKWNIPKELWKLVNLQFLSLDNCNLEWEIPKELWNLKILISLDLYNNKLVWEIPIELWNLKKLQHYS